MAIYKRIEKILHLIRTKSENLRLDISAENRLKKDQTNLSNYLIVYTKKNLLSSDAGGFSAHKMRIKIRLGASLVQLITGMVYQGPGLIGPNQSRASRLAQEGWTEAYFRGNRER